MYLNNSIEDFLKSQNPLVKILVILDRIIGERMLKKMKVHIEKEEAIIQYFYKFRCNADGIC